MASAPRTVYRIPPRFSRLPTVLLQPASTTPEDTHRPLRTELCVLHARTVPFQIACSAMLAENRDDLVDLTVFEGVALLFRSRLRKVSVTVDLLRLAPQVLFRMEQDLDSVGEQFVGDVPDPERSISQDHASFGVVEAATAQLDPLSERRQFLVGIEGSGALDADGDRTLFGCPFALFFGRPHGDAHLRCFTL